MKKTRTTAAAVALTAVAAIGGGQALAAGDGPKDFKAIAKVVSTHANGDTAVFKEKLKVGGEKAGKAKIKLAFKDDGDIKLSGTWRFNDGTIKAKGKVKGNKPKAKIVRATGAYKGGEGTVTLESQTEKRSLETFNFK